MSKKNSEWIARPALKGGYVIEALDGCPIVCHMDEELRYGPIETESNARLIAAAPEMLEALVGLELLARDLLLRIDGGWSERNFRLPEEIMAAQAAIRKARGEE